ncbi:MAG: hypothetical protein HY717_15205 [Planctomycetes bacterium]|nr:hypothetical protein [Planctomycetota bacterium]
MSVSASFEGNSNVQQILDDLINTGRKLLQAQPMDREHYRQWSDSARKQLAESYGPTDPKVREFFTSRREISTSFELDPSYYLTQIGANLRRELKVLEKISREQGESPAAATAPTARGPTPQAPRAAAGAPSAARKVLILAGKGSELIGPGSQAAGEAGFATEILPDEKRRSSDALRAALVASRPNAVVVVWDQEPSSPSRSGATPVEAALELGLAIGIFSPAKVLILFNEKTPPPENAGGAAQIPLRADPGWEEALKKALMAIP